MGRKSRLHVPLASPGERRVVLSLYKSLLRLAGKFDDQHTAKALVYRSQRPDKNIYGQDESVQEGHRYYSTVLQKIFEKSLLLPPDRLNYSFRELIKTQFRKESEVPLQAKIQCAFKGIRTFSNIWSLYSSTVLRPLEDGSRKVVEIPPAAAPTKVPIALNDRVFPGVVLAAHPLVHGPLSRAVILVLQHGKEGSYGVVINHRSHLKLSDVIKNLPANMLHIFSSNHTHYGGPVKRLQCIHKFPQFSGTKIMGSTDNECQLFCGGITEDNLNSLSAETSASDADKSDLSRDHFHFFTGCCTWNAGELNDQITEGFWMPMVLAPEDVWKLIEQEKLESSIDNSKSDTAVADQLDVSASQDSGSEKNAETYVDFSKYQLSTEDGRTEDVDAYVTPGGKVRNSGWSWLMAAAGPPYTHFGRVPFVVDVEDVDAVD